MTPSEWLVEAPSNEILIHEIGHTLTGLALGINEQGIELLKPGKGEAARSWYNRLKLPLHLELPRVLSGMYCQAKLCPSALDANLSRNLVELELFTEPSIVRDDGPLLPIMAKCGLHGDWALLTGLLAGKTDPAQRLKVARSAHKKVAYLFEKHRFAEAIPSVIHDISQWLCTPDEDLPFTRQLFYPVTRIRSSLDAFNARLRSGT
jgi:hypothetical protein